MSLQFEAPKAVILVHCLSKEQGSDIHNHKQNMLNSSSSFFFFLSPVQFRHFSEGLLKYNKGYDNLMSEDWLGLDIGLRPSDIISHLILTATF